MAVAAGVGVATLYYAQPLLPELGRTFGRGEASMALVVTATQAGYVIGLLALLPLGDRLPRRRLVPAVSAASAVALTACAASPGYPALVAASLAVGATAVSGQLLVPFAADLAGEERRGRVVARVMSGILSGILLARLASGLVTGLSSWRVVFAAAAVASAAMAVLLALALPGEPVANRPQRSALAPLLAFRRLPELRRRAALGALCFGAFTVLWTALPFRLSAAPYHLGPAGIGLSSLVGLAGVAAANLAGHHADQGRAGRGAVVAAAAVATGAMLCLLGPGVALVLGLGVLVLDAGVQGMAISNQAIYYGLDPSSRSSTNAAYMATSFTGGAAASVAAGWALQAGGFSAAMWLATAMGALAVALATAGRHAGKP